LIACGAVSRRIDTIDCGCELDISEITVKAHRGSVMRKLAAGSFAEQVNMSVDLRYARRFS
jgi:FixJ family two-component response regulator